jgi:hypothetical protein
VLGKAWSSLLLRSSFSWKVGDGARTAGVLLRWAVGGSEKERDLEGVLTPCSTFFCCCSMASIAASIVGYAGMLAVLEAVNGG